MCIRDRQYTSPDGETSILPWCMLSDGRMIYLANKVGKYELVHNAKSFTCLLYTSTRWPRANM